MHGPDAAIDFLCPGCGQKHPLPAPPLNPPKLKERLGCYMARMEMETFRFGPPEIEPKEESPYPAIQEVLNFLFGACLILLAISVIHLQGEIH